MYCAARSTTLTAFVILNLSPNKVSANHNNALPEAFVKLITSKQQVYDHDSRRKLMASPEEARDMTKQTVFESDFGSSLPNQGLLWAVELG